MADGAVYGGVSRDSNRPQDIYGNKK